MGKPVLQVDSAVLLNANDPQWSHCTWRLLAEGDSWFSIGSLNLFESANLLLPMAFSEFAAVVQLAYPGDTLRRIAQMRSDPRLERLLTGNVSWRWDGILLSCGGNDLIDAVQVPPAHDLHLRLLRTQTEWGPPSAGVARYLSEPGWETFATYFRANLDLIIRLRDKKAGPNGNRGRPVFMHTYAYPTPRPSGAGLGQGPWLLPAMLAYAIPQADWTALARALVDRLAELLLACAADASRYPALHVFDSRKLGLVPAAVGATGESGDWLNEIHLTKNGCQKVSLPWCQAIEQVMRQNP
jgi:lysophospholipase L1-like esterase